MPEDLPPQPEGGIRQRYRPLTDVGTWAEELVSAVKELADTQTRLARVTRERDHYRQLALTDRITQVLTRTGLEEWIQNGLQQSALTYPQGIPLSAAFVDVRDFKELNDLFGYPVGDGVLGIYGGAWLVSLDRAPSRHNETPDPCAIPFSSNTVAVARFGGDEFVLLAFGDFDFNRAFGHMQVEFQALLDQRLESLQQNTRQPERLARQPHSIRAAVTTTNLASSATASDVFQVIDRIGGVIKDPHVRDLRRSQEFPASFAVDDTSGSLTIYLIEPFMLSGSKRFLGEGAYRTLNRPFEAPPPDQLPLFELNTIGLI